MSFVRMPLPSAGGHPLFLPPDYDSLSLEGQRLARVNAAIQWKAPGSPSARAEALLTSFRFFHSYYLRDDPDANFFPSFFEGQPLPFAPFHEDIICSHAIDPFLVVGAPRGSAKSTLLEQIRLLIACSAPLHGITVCFGGNRLVKRFGARFKAQMNNNFRLNDDFGHDFGGRLVPARGKAPFADDMAFLTNGSWISHTTTQSFQRGDAPHVYHMDDPEYDPEGASTSMQRLREEVERLIFKIIMPMLNRRAFGQLVWLGTTISRAHLLFKALQSEGEGFGHDPRFEYWRRMHLRALYKMPDGTEASIWPEMWSADRLRDFREQMGIAAFRAEYMNDPGAGEGQYFFTDQRHAYRLTNPDEQLVPSPYLSRTTISWDRKGSTISQPLCDFLKQNSVFITVDSAPTSTPTSDFNAIVCMAITPFNELFILDVFNRRVKEHVTALEAMKMADRWRAQVIAVELHSKSQGVYGALQHLLGTRAEAIEQVEHLPALKPLRVGFAAKTARISAMQYRFGDATIKDPSVHGYGGLIKLPLDGTSYLRSPEWQALQLQIDGFNPEAADGGLENDDLLDAVAMHQEVVKGLSKKPTVAGPAKTALDLLKEGHTKTEDGNTILAHLVNWSTIPPDDFNAIIEATRRRGTNAGPTPSKV